jgi:hypothetical protein
VQKIDTGSVHIVNVVFSATSLCLAKVGSLEIVPMHFVPLKVLSSEF